MAGLLDFLNTDEARLGIGLLGAGAPQTDPSKTGLGFAMQSGMDAVDANKKAQMARMYAQSQIMENMSQAQARQGTALAAQRTQQALANAWKPDGTLDVQGLAGAGVKPEDILNMGKFPDIGRPEVARTIEEAGPTGPVTVQLDKFGRRIGEAAPAWKAPIMVNQGGQQTAVDPSTMKPIASFGVSASPDSKLSSDTSIRNADLAATTSRGNKLIDMEWEREKATASTQHMTEDQRKAVQPLIEADLALKQVLSLGVDENGKLKPAAYAGLGDAARALGMRMTANLISGGDRQQYNNAMETLSAAFLRAATGAGMNKDEAEGAYRRYVPQIGEADQVKKSKLDALPAYLKALEARAGPQGQKIAQEARNVAPVVNLKPTETAPTKSEFVNINGTQQIAKRGTDGRLYVQTQKGWAPVLKE